ncbi:HpcH/HpaI aldolase/citrate lyase family protein [Penicillium longicatenatum]|uniref:HpcH/HpaI aldolase/citrate lyase family protein n=1 Tax=Penicillium longicatenatum TaxID=1561947 RepID=UPI002546A82D|nr:HpcH/HpaI aldolase/citrate lyase family protein [Penicillium longicatenatum]KAJ5642851.1 HpcH/HpaI aldolase/citrate lyase family protein [Penicillium longicatenatum]
MAATIASPVVSPIGKTRLQASWSLPQRGKGLAPLGEDWVLIDCEHGDIDDKEMYLQVGAISSAGVSPIVRIPAAEPWMMKRALDCGAHGIMVPMCDTKEQAEAIVRSCKYPSTRWPQGVRGAGAMFAPAAFNQNGRDYLAHANTNVTIIVQIESKLGVENCEAIASVDGIDMLFIGPNDLASSMGYVAFDHPKIPKVQEAIQRVLVAAKAAGKYAGHFALSAETAAKKYKQGFDFVNCGADIVAVTAWMATEIANLKAKTATEQKGSDPGAPATNGYK